jgi:hypothetical protein
MQHQTERLFLIGAFAIKVRLADIGRPEEEKFEAV